MRAPLTVCRLTVENNYSSEPVSNNTEAVSDYYSYMYDYYGFGDPDVYLPTLNVLLCAAGGTGSFKNIFVYMDAILTKTKSPK